MIPLKSEEKTEMNQQNDEKTVYVCPMHSEVKSDQPGKCPKCGMNLELKK